MWHDPESHSQTRDCSSISAQTLNNLSHRAINSQSISIKYQLPNSRPITSRIQPRSQADQPQLIKRGVAFWALTQKPMLLPFFYKSWLSSWLI